MARAGRVEELRDLLTCFPWLLAKLRATHVTSVLADFDFMPQVAELRVVHEAVKRSAQILQQDPGQLAAQLLGWLLLRPESAIHGLLKEAAAWEQSPWLRPLTPNLTPPGDPLLFTLSGHEGTVRSLAVTQDGRWADKWTKGTWEMVEFFSSCGHSMVEFPDFKNLPHTTARGDPCHSKGKTFSASGNCRTMKSSTF